MPSLGSKPKPPAKLLSERYLWVRTYENCRDCSQPPNFCNLLLCFQPAKSLCRLFLPDGIDYASTLDRALWIQTNNLLAAI